MPRGKLIVFEGLDRAGKSTQVQSLVEKLRGEGVKVREMRFPGTYVIGITSATSRWSIIKGVGIDILESHEQVWWHGKLYRVPVVLVSRVELEAKKIHL